MITSHCKLENGEIEYLLEIPLYENKKERSLLQITPIPILKDKRMFMLDYHEEFIIEEKGKLLIAESLK